MISTHSPEQMVFWGYIVLQFEGPYFGGLSLNPLVMDQKWQGVVRHILTTLAGLLIGLEVLPESLVNSTVDAILAVLAGIAGVIAVIHSWRSKGEASKIKRGVYGEIPKP